MPAGAEKSAFRRASASAPSIVEARESAVFKPCRITVRVYARPPTRRRRAHCADARDGMPGTPRRTRPIRWAPHQTDPGRTP